MVKSWSNRTFNVRFDLRIVSVAAINSIEVADFAIGSSSKVAGRAQGRTEDTMKISFDMIFGRILDKLCYLWQIGTSGTSPRDCTLGRRVYRGTIPIYSTVYIHLLTHHLGL